MTSDPREIRKILPIGIPSALALLAFGYLLTFHILVPTLAALNSPPPVLRIYAGALLGPFILPLALMLLVVPPMKAVPVFESFTKKTEKPFNWLVLANAAALVLVLATSTFLQHRFMPRLGYAECTELQGNPSFWFTDWAKSPEFCVAGKTPEWVNGRQRQSGAFPAN